MAIITNFSNQYAKIVKNENVFISGNLFMGDKLISGNILLSELGAIRCIDQLKNKLTSYNGFFAFIINQGNKLFAAVDRIRSIPLFYGEKDSVFYISDDAKWIREQIAGENMIRVTQEEFLLTGYVTGQDTLWNNVKQLQAGEYLYLKNDDGSIEITTGRYYRFLHKEPEILSEVELLRKDLDRIMDSVIKRLITYVRGRQIVIPLSAGRDSRLIALKLKQFRYKKVLCFSYGVIGNFEAETSKKVAGLLEFPWEYVEYTEELWETWFNTTERKKYFDMACNGLSLPVIQDWPAVWELKKRGVIESDAVFVPGHSGDFPAGSHIPSDAYPATKACMSDLVCSILKSHYSLVGWSRKLNKTRKYWKNRIIKNCEIQEIADGYEYADAFEKWDWQERQAKFIVNSIRVYEFFGFDWWLPFWDNDFMCYWQSIPLKYRKNKNLYNEYVDNLYETITGDRSCIEFHKEKPEYIKLLLKLLLKKLHLYYFILGMNDHIKRRIKVLNTVNIHAFYGVFSEEYKKKYRKKANNSNGLLAIFVLNEMDGNVDSIIE
jgi:asparagine synthase (glutamine-hydrolysing)